MADRLNNIAGLFKDSRTRTIVLATLIILLLAIVVGIVSMRGKSKGVEAAAGVSQAPTNIRSVPFEAPNAEYAKLQQQQNVDQAKQAEQQGSSAIPTIFRAGKDSGPVPGAEASEGVGFTALNREQSDAGTFAAKEFKVPGTSQSCPVCPVPGTDFSTSPLGVPVYDDNGRLIGYADANGNVRNGVTGKIIGTLGPDGVVRDSGGRPIGQKGSLIAGTPVYDDKGNLIGTVDADGKMRDVSGKLITNGHPGTPVYDKNGNLIGFAGPDGKVRDANGSIIGTVGPDGVVRDVNGNIIGKAGAITPGTPVYDANGNLLGTVGPDGKVRDANGRIIGTVGLDGKLRDANGNIMGSIVKPEAKAPAVPAGASGATTAANTGAVTASAESQQNQIEERRRQILADQKLSQEVQQKQQAMTAQANQLLVAWSPPSQQYVQAQEQQSTGGAEEASGGNKLTLRLGEQGGKSENTGPVLIKAGTVYFATINTAINSDEPGPVMATIISGNFKGGRLLGSIMYQKSAVMITFNTLTMPNFPKSIKINAVAIDQNTARTGISTETNNHYLLRYGSVFAAALVQGYGQALTTAGSTTSTNGLSVQTSTPDLNPAQKFYVALGNVGTQFNSQASNLFNTPPTVLVASGTAVGILFMDDVQAS